MAQDSKATGKQDAKPSENTAGKSSAVKNILIWGLSALLIIGGSVGGTLYFTGALRNSGHGEASAVSHPTTEHASAPATSHDPVTIPPQYVALDPPFIVNFEDQGMLRYLQIGVTVMARDKLAMEAVTNNMPPIRNSLIMLFASQNTAALGSKEGKEKLRDQALQEIQSILRKEIGRPGVEAVYFTNLVMQ